MNLLDKIQHNALVSGGALEIGETPNGKKIAIFNAPNTSMYAIKFIPGGELPQELEGLFTSPTEATLVVHRYLAHNKNKKEK